MSDGPASPAWGDEAVGLIKRVQVAAVPASAPALEPTPEAVVATAGQPPAAAAAAADVAPPAASAAVETKEDEAAAETSAQAGDDHVGMCSKGEHWVNMLAQMRTCSFSCFLRPTAALQVLILQICSSVARW